MPPQYTQFKNVTDLDASLASDQIEANLVSWFDWSFLQVGGFFNVTFPARGTRLRMASDPDYVDGQVWEGYRQGWVWETGVPYASQPVGVSGVWVGNAFAPYGSGYHIDYPLGRVVFDAPLPASSQVRCEFSFRRVMMATADAEWFQALHFNTLDLQNDAAQQAQFAEVASGVWDVLAQNRVQLPAVVVEAVNRVRLVPLQIGNASRIHEQDVLLHVLAETPFDRKQLHDLIVEQWDTTLQFFDKNAVEDADVWPLDERGTPRPGALTYPTLVAPTGEGGYRWRVCNVTQMRSEPQTSFPPLYRATCRATLQLYLP